MLCTLHTHLHTHTLHAHTTHTLSDTQHEHAPHTHTRTHNTHTHTHKQHTLHLCIQRSQVRMSHRIRRIRPTHRHPLLVVVVRVVHSLLRCCLLLLLSLSLLSWCIVVLIVRVHNLLVHTHAVPVKRKHTYSSEYTLSR